MYHFVWIGDCHSFLQRMVNTGWVLKWNLRLILCPGFLSNFLILIFAPYTMGVIYSYHGNSLPAMRIAFTYYTFVWQYKRKFSASLKYHDLAFDLQQITYTFIWLPNCIVHICQFRAISSFVIWATKLILLIVLCHFPLPYHACYLYFVSYIPFF